MSEPYVIADGQAYGYSLYPPTLIESMGRQGTEPSQYLGDIEMSPDDAPYAMAMLYHNQDALFVNGRLARDDRRRFELGYAIEEVGLDPLNRPSFSFYLLEGPNDDAADAKWAWCVENATGNWFAKAEERDPEGQSCMMVLVWFQELADEAAFIDAFSGAVS